MTKSTTQEDEIYAIALDCYHAGSIGQPGKTIHSGTVKKWTDAITQQIERAKIEARIEELRIANTHILSFSYNEPSKQKWYGHFAKRIAALENELKEMEEK